MCISVLSADIMILKIFHVLPLVVVESSQGIIYPECKNGITNQMQQRLKKRQIVLKMNEVSLHESNIHKQNILAVH